MAAETNDTVNTVYIAQDHGIKPQPKQILTKPYRISGHKTIETRSIAYLESNFNNRFSTLR